jgi:hypothetical protein
MVVRAFGLNSVDRFQLVNIAFELDLQKRRSRREKAVQKSSSMEPTLTIS